MNIKPQQATQATNLPLSKKAPEETETDRQFQELREMFCSDNRPAEISSVQELTQTLKDLKTRISQEQSGEFSQKHYEPLPSRLQSSLNTERTTVFDHINKD